jgi:AcrR family transcriptional regulator
VARQGTEITRDNLLNATHDLLVERGVGPSSVSDICERAGVSVAMVKYHFGNKDGLLDALLERVLERLAAEIARLDRSELPPRDKLHAHVAAVVRNYVRFPYVNRLMNERLLQAEPDAVDRISRAFASPARDWYGTLLADGRREHGWCETDPTWFFFSTIGICEFVFAGRPLLERAFGVPLSDGAVDAYVAHAMALVEAGLTTPGPVGRRGGTR